MQYKVQHKVRATVKDNRSNFVKAFREFETTDEAAPDELDDGIRFLDMATVLEMERDEEINFFLPYPSSKMYLINLTATNEVDKTASKGPSRKSVPKHNGSELTYGRHKAHQSSAAAEALQVYCKHESICSMCQKMKL